MDIYLTLDIILFFVLPALIFIAIVSLFDEAWNYFIKSVAEEMKKK